MSLSMSLSIWEHGSLVPSLVEYSAGLWSKPPSTRPQTAFHGPRLDMYLNLFYFFVLKIILKILLEI